MSSTVYDALAPHGLTVAECQQKYGQFLALSSRLVGHAMTKFASIAHLSPLTSKPYMGTLRSFFRVPSCDFGVAALSSRQRRLILIDSSATHGCAFCTAHTACMGDALAGSKLQQCSRAGRFVPEEKEDGDAEIAALVREVCGFPGLVTESTCEAFENKFGKKGYLETAAFLAFMAWLNYNMDVLGISLESEIAPFAQMILAPRNLPFDVTDFVANDGNEDAGRERAKFVSSGAAAGPWKRAMAHLSNVWALVTLVPQVVKALSTEAEWYKGLPVSMDELKEWRRTQFGCDLQFDSEMDNEEVKRAIAFVCREVFLNDDSTRWTRYEKFALLFVFGKGVENMVIAEDAVALAAAQRVKEDVLSTSGSASLEGEDDSHESITRDVRKELEKVFTTAASEEKPTDAFSAAAKFMYTAAGPAGNVAKSGTTQDLLTHVDAPEARMSVIGMVGAFAMMHRMAVMCGGK